jgi:hypothetical protein
VIVFCFVQQETGQQDERMELHSEMDIKTEPEDCPQNSPQYSSVFIPEVKMLEENEIDPLLQSQTNSEVSNLASAPNSADVNAECESEESILLRNVTFLRQPAAATPTDNCITVLQQDSTMILIINDQSVNQSDSDQKASCSAGAVTTNKMCGKKERTKKVKPVIACDFCVSVFDTVSLLQGHCSHQHSRFMCGQCEVRQYFDTPQELHQHLRIVHTSCQYCGDSFLTKGRMTAHLERCHDIYM